MQETLTDIFVRSLNQNGKMVQAVLRSPDPEVCEDKIITAIGIVYVIDTFLNRVKAYVPNPTRPSGLELAFTEMIQMGQPS